MELVLLDWTFVRRVDLLEAEHWSADVTMDFAVRRKFTCHYITEL